MNKNKNWFTLVELIVTITIITIVFMILLNIAPSFINHFLEQKNKLKFQQSFMLDNFYLNNKITNSFKLLSNYSSWTYKRTNSYLTLANKNWDFPYSFIYLWDNEWKILENWEKKWKIIVKNTFLYSDYVKVGNNIYYTNPWEHTIYKYDIMLNDSILVYWTKGQYWYNNLDKWLFNTPTWITYDWENTLYISDSWNNLIRTINIINWNIWKIAWNEFKSGYNKWETKIIWTDLSESLFDYPTWIVFYDNNIYLSDTHNNIIRKIDLLNNKIYTLLWSENRWFNLDNWFSYDLLINWPLALIKVSNWLIFWDVLNWKIRYYNENDDTLTTILWIEKLNNNIIDNKFSKYSKNFFNSYILSHSNWFYFNDSKNGIIYDYNFWNNNIIWDFDDSIVNLLWNLDKNILLNWDIENDIFSVWDNNDLFIPDSELFYKTSDEYFYPISWNAYLSVNTKWKYASWYINFISNMNDWDTLHIWDKIFEFDNGFLNYNLSNVVVPIWTNLSETIDNLKDLLINYDISYSWTWNTIKILSNIIGPSWNNITLSWSSINYHLENFNNKLSWWIEYTNWFFNFGFIKDFLFWEKYKLSFYISSDNIIYSDVINPLLKIQTWTWNIEEKLLYVNDKWSKKEFIIDWIWNNQLINFFVKYWERLYFDWIKIEPIWELQSFNIGDKNKFKIWILNSFFVIDENNIILDNTLDKKLMLLSPSDLFIINDDFSFFDFKSLSLNLKNDYLWNSEIENFKFIYKKNNIVYNIWVNNYNLKISNNIK